MSNNYSFEVLHWEKNFGKPMESWTYFPIDKLIKERKDSRVNDGSLKLCSLTIEEGVVEKSDRYNREFLLKNQEENKYKCVHPNDIVINPMNLRFGAVAKSEQVDPVLVSGYYNVVSASKLVDTDYLSAFLKSAAMSYMYERVALGSLNEKKRVHLSELKKIVVPLPSIKEQLKIGKILSTWDNAIATTERLIVASKQQKQALMQQLLTGKKRLIDPETGKAFEGEWETGQFDKLFNIEIGGTPSRSNETYWDDKLETNNNWLSIADLKGKSIYHTKERISDLGVAKSNVSLIPKGTIVMSFKLTIGR
ncbi:TPA: restriction endonuclease subunit S, partial [Vibrio parahaemolyticus]